jgi:anti-sigma factor RsiW
MTDPCCNKLEDYLSGALPRSEGAEFLTHLDECPACRRAVRWQNRLDSELARAVAALNPVPADLADRVELRIRSLHRRQVRQALARVAAVLFAAVVLGSWFLRAPRPPMEAPANVATPSSDPSPAVPSEERTAVSVTFPQDSSVIALPARTANPHVTILWVYPATEGAQGRKGESSPRPKPRKESS